jgi:hypothetical protein
VLHSWRLISRGDNTVTTNALSTSSRSSIVLDRMGATAAVGRIWQSAPKVEGLACLWTLRLEHRRRLVAIAHDKS